VPRLASSRRAAAGAALLATAILAAAACSSGSSDTGSPLDSSGPAGSSPPTSGIEILEPTDVSIEGIRIAPAGEPVQMVAFSADEQACIRSAADQDPVAKEAVDLSADDMDLDQATALAGVAVPCLGPARIQDLAVTILRASPVVETTDDACIRRDVEGMSDPDQMAGLLAGDPATIAVLSQEVSINCG
jgi:hypothetical protein